MKLIRFNPIDKYKSLYVLNLHFDQETGVLSGTVGTKGSVGDVIRDFSIPLSEWVGKIVNVQLIPTAGEGYSVIYYQYGKNHATGNGRADSKYNGQGLLHLFRICVHENLDESTILVTSPHGEIEGFENTVFDMTDPAERIFVFQEFDETASEIMLREEIKSKMIGKIDPFDSLAYLEAQVDLLTRLVLLMAKSYSGSIPEEIVSALETADSESVLGIKSLENVEKEFSVNKHRVREAQDEYYKTVYHDDDTAVSS